MADRTTKEIELPVSKQKAVVYEWANGGDKRVLSSENDAAKRIQLMIERIVVSIGDEKKDLIKVLDELHGKDFDFLVDTVSNVLVDSSLTPEKKTS